MTCASKFSPTNLHIRAWFTHCPTATCLSSSRRPQAPNRSDAPRTSSKATSNRFATISQSQYPSQTDSGGSNRITLLRDADADGTPEVRSVFLDKLDSPFGVVLVGSDLY